MANINEPDQGGFLRQWRLCRNAPLALRCAQDERLGNSFLMCCGPFAVSLSNHERTCNTVSGEEVIPKLRAVLCRSLDKKATGCRKLVIRR